MLLLCCFSRCRSCLERLFAKETCYTAQSSSESGNADSEFINRTTGWTDEELQQALSSLIPQVVDKALADMGAGMDERGERLFANEAHGEVWDDQFDQNYLSGFQSTNEHHAGAKANLDARSKAQARKPRTIRGDEDLEDGEIWEDEDMSSG